MVAQLTLIISCIISVSKCITNTPTSPQPAINAPTAEPLTAHPTNLSAAYVIVSEQTYNSVEGEEECKRRFNTHLASLHKISDELEVINHCLDVPSRRCWIGGNRVIPNHPTDCSWKWIDNSIWDYEPRWHTGEGCGFTQPQMCIVNGGIHDCHGGNASFDEHYYIICNAPTKYVTINDQGYLPNDAEQECQTRYNGHLASLHNISDQIEVINICNNNSLPHKCWLGGLRNASIGNTDCSWKWTDSTNWNNLSVQWTQGEGCGFDQPYMCVFNGGIHDCHGRNEYWWPICSVPVTTTFPPTQSPTQSPTPSNAGAVILEHIPLNNNNNNNNNNNSYHLLLFFRLTIIIIIIITCINVFILCKNGGVIKVVNYEEETDLKTEPEIQELIQ